MFNVNQFVVVGKFKIIKALNNTTYIYLIDNSDYQLQIIVDNLLISKIKNYLGENDYIGIKGHITCEKEIINLYAEKIAFLSRHN